MNTYENFDLKLEKTSKTYIPLDIEEKKNYIKNVLSKRKFDYDSDSTPTKEELLELVALAYARMNQKRSEINFSTDTNVLINLKDNSFVKISMDGTGFEILNNINNLHPYVIYELDLKLLTRILKGPKYAHWNNAEIGSHIKFNRNPNKFERGLYHAMNFFHA